MRRDAVIKRLCRRLKRLENCKLGYAEANGILKIIEECEPTLYNSWDWKNKKKRKKK